MGILLKLGQIAGLAGLSVGLIVLLGRVWLKPVISPSLTPTQAYKLLRQFAFLMFAVGALGIVAWIFASSRSAQAPEENRSISIRPVDPNSLKSAEVTFHTGLHKKKASTKLSVRLKRLPSTAFAMKENMQGDFDQHHTTKDLLDTQGFSPFYSDDSDSSTLEIAVEPGYRAGKEKRETWTFSVTLLLRFNNAKTRERSWTDITLTDHNKLASLAWMDGR